MDDASPSLQSLQILSTVTIGGMLLLIRYIQKRRARAPFSSRREVVSRALRKIRSQATLTRTGVTLGKLADDPKVWAEPRLRLVESLSELRYDFRPDSEYLRNAIESQSANRLCILAPAGFGKSTILKRLFCEAAQNYLDGTIKTCPVFIDFGEDLDFSDLDQIMKIGRSDERVLFFLDGIDEALSSGQRSSLNNVISKIEPDDSAIIASRPLGYSGFLKGSNLTITVVMEISGYSDGVLSRHCMNLIENIWQESDAHQAGSLIKSAISRGVLNTPLHIALALQGYMDGYRRISGKISSISEVYGKYISAMIDRECSKLGCPISTIELRQILDRLAFILVTSHGSISTFVTSAAVVNLETLHQAADYVLGNARIGNDSRAITEWLIVRSVLEPTSAINANWTFTHPSIFDYLVANCVITSLVGHAADVPSLLQTNLPQEVYEFLKVMISNLSPDTSKAICSNSEKVLAGTNPNSKSDPRTSIMLEQLGHILGHIRDDRAAQIASKIAVRFPSAFIIRGIAIGLAFGGNELPLREYVVGLERELERHGVGSMNLINLRHQLAYFGDLDEIMVDKAGLLGLNTATFTVKKLCDQLSSQVHGAAKLLDLYTLRVIISLGRASHISIADLHSNLARIADAGRAHCQSTDTLISNQASKLVEETENWRIECKIL